MRARGILNVGFTEVEILEIMETVKKELRAGKSIVQYSAEGNNVIKTLFAGMTPQQVLLECQAGLRSVKPSQYPAPVNHQRANNGGSFSR